MHALEVRALDAVPEVADDGIDEEHLAVLVPVHAPGVRGAVAVGFVDLPRGVVAPDAASGGLALVLGRAGHVHPARAADADASVKPAVRPPFQAVGEGVATGGGGAEAVKDDLRRAARLVVLRGNPEQVRRAEGIHAAEAALDAGEHLQVVAEDGALVEVAGVLRVLEDENAVAQLQVEALLAIGVGVVLGDPEAAFFIPAHGDGLLNVRLMREDGGLEAGWEVHHADRLLRRRERDGFDLIVRRRRELGAERQEAEGKRQKAEARGHGGVGEAEEEMEQEITKAREDSDSENENLCSLFCWQIADKRGERMRLTIMVSSCDLCFVIFILLSSS